MRVVLAPRDFAGDVSGQLSGQLSAREVAEAMARGWRSAAPADDLVLAPMSDGGPGFLEAVFAAVGGQLLPVTVRGPRGDPTPATVLFVDGEPSTAYVEIAQAVGIHLVAPDRRDPGAMSSYGAGELVRAAVATGATRVVVGVGGTATNDGGAGLLAALGAGRAEALASGGLALADVTAADLDGIASVRRSLAGVDLVLASASDVPLLGFHGSSATYAEGKGASPETAQRLEAAIGHYADLAVRALPGGRPLLGGGPATQAGAGAGGGIGFALLLLGATRVDGVAAVAGATALADRIAGSDLVVTGQGTFDWEALRGGVVAEVAALGLAAGVPVVLVAAEVLVGRRESMTLGLAGTYAVAERTRSSVTSPSESARSHPEAAVEARAARVARTWSRP